MACNTHDGLLDFSGNRKIYQHHQKIWVTSARALLSRAKWSETQYKAEHEKSRVCAIEMIRIRGASPHGDDPSHCKEPQKITDPLLEVDILKSKRKRRKKKRKTKEQRKEKGCALWGNSGRGGMPEKMLRTAKASWQGVFLKSPCWVHR